MKYKSKTGKHLPRTWEKISRVQVLDPDGWRRDGASWNKPISKEEWLQRMSYSTCLPESDWISTFRRLKEAT